MGCQREHLILEDFGLPGWWSRLGAPGPKQRKSRGTIANGWSEWVAPFANAYSLFRGQPVVGFLVKKEKVPGHKWSISCSARAAVASRKSCKYPLSFWSSPRSHKRMSVATWSFLLRPVCNFPPISLPIISPSRRSLAVWISSSFSWAWKVPACHSWAICWKPLSISDNSWAVRIPHLWFARAKAILPSMSWRQNRES